MSNNIVNCSFLGKRGEGNIYADQNVAIHLKDIVSIVNPEWEMHTHDFFEFDIVIAGNGKNITCDGVTLIETGDLLFGTPASMHTVRCLDGIPFRMLNVQFIGNFEKLILENFGMLEPFVVKLSPKELEYICSEFDSIIEWKSLPSIRMYVRGVMEKILAIIHKAYFTTQRPSVISKREHGIHEALLLIRKNYNKPIKLNDIATSVGYNSGYLGQLIKQYTGESFTSYLLNIRLENAYLMLMDKSKSVQQVCNEVGYSSYSNFFYAFKKRFGITPTDLMENYEKMQIGSKSVRIKNANKFISNSKETEGDLS